jgi:hypothetical protein
MEKKLGFLLGLILILGSQALFAAPTSDEYLDAANKLFQEKNFDKALIYYQASAQTDPQNWKAYEALGNCELSLGQRENAINDFQKSLNINPKNPPLQTLMNKLSQTGPAPVHVSSSLPEKGKVILVAGGAANLYSWQDLVNYYTPVPFSPPSSTPLGAEFELGLHYTVTHSFQLGLQAQTILKESESVAITNTGVTLIFSEACIGGAAVAEYLMPLGAKLNLVLHGEGGIYTFIGSTFNVTDSTSTNRWDMHSTAVGAMPELIIDWVQDGWALDLGFGYRFLTFGSVTLTSSNGDYNGSPTLLNYYNQAKATLDFSGPRVSLTARIF